MKRVTEVQIEQIQEFYTNLFINFYSRYCQSSLGGEDFSVNNEFDEFQKINWGDFEPLNYLEDARGDVGIGIYRVPISDYTTITCRIVTNGDDGWLLIFDKNGKFLAAGETDYPAIVWASQELIHLHTDSEEFLNNYWGSCLPNFWEDKKREHIKIEEIMNERLYNLKKSK